MSNTSGNGTLEGRCYDPGLPSMLIEWNETLYTSLVEDRGCNCSMIRDHNGVSNLICSGPMTHPWYVQLLYITMFAVIIVMGCLGNSIVIWIVLAHRRMRTVTNYFLLNLAISDLSVSIFNVCFSFTYNLYFDWFFGSAYCHLNNMMGVMPTCSSVLTLMAMSLDRYMAIVHPLRPRLSRKKTLACIASIWLLSILCGLPSLLFTQTITLYFERDIVHICSTNNFPSQILLEVHNHFLLALMYLLPLVVLSFTYLFVSRELWGNQSIGDYKQEGAIKAKKRVVKMMIVVVSLFLVCWLPYNLYHSVLVTVLNNRFDTLTNLHIYLNMYWLAMTSTVVNPVIYCYMNKRFRTGFKYVFRWVPCLRMTTQEYTNSDLCDNPRRYSQSTYVRSVSRMNRTPTYSTRASHYKARRHGDMDDSSSYTMSEPPSTKHSLSNGNMRSRRTDSMIDDPDDMPLSNIHVINSDTLKARKSILKVYDDDYAQHSPRVAEADVKLHDVTDLNENALLIHSENVLPMDDLSSVSCSSDEGRSPLIGGGINMSVSVSLHALNTQSYLTSTEIPESPKRSQTLDEFMMVLKL